MNLRSCKAISRDLRYKMKVVKYLFPKIYGGAANYEIEEVRKTCYDLLQEYHSRSTNLKPESSQSSLAATFDESPEPDECMLYGFFNSFIDGHAKLELDHYLKDKVLPFTKTFDILSWWKTNGIKYPTLQMIARDFLTIPISTVASELAFSTGGRVMTDHRSRLKPYTLEALMCTQN
ncbi:BED zinc finger,hAT family dimerization domain [Theobroma cacao]|uniref:BED zinc finger,hAT family dimerization domain n=1 Tax=Theobroma cacao TaxID=3641 RepID=A0A061EME4_THECC|nr:BED zinc finger,hAT family dimerization domain [Theobroma cacao]